ncbi:AAA family ATPase [Streptomyces acidicola]|uniref:AAA family ATPase n=1 Tax=Streptomyces acidicola TaxID=2596892 RepID=UPI00343414F9
MIDRLTLTNFKAFQTADIPLAPLTLLTGLNSSGKSTVLQALALLRQSFTSGNLGDEVLNDEADAGFLLNGEFVGLGTGQDVLHDGFTEDLPRITLRVTEGSYDYTWSADYAPEQNLLPLVSTTLPAFQEGGHDAPEGDAAWAPGYFTNGFQYLHADRITPTERYPRDHHMAVRRGFLGIRGEHTVNFLRHHDRDEVPDGPLRHPRADGPRLMEQVVAWMRELCPGVNITTDVIEGTDSVRLAYAFGEGVNATHSRRPTNVGFGLTYALPIVVACLTARPGSLVLLENPEAHLHPRGQTKMAELAAASAAQGAQLVIESHSDHVLNGMRLAVKRGLLEPSQALIHYFRSAGDGSGAEVISPSLDRDGLLDQWPNGFFDEMDHVLDQLLT